MNADARKTDELIVDNVEQKPRDFRRRKCRYSRALLNVHAPIPELRDKNMLDMLSKTKNQIS